MKDRIRIVTACGVGMGSSLILKMMIEDLLKRIRYKCASRKY